MLDVPLSSTCLPGCRTISAWIVMARSVLSLWSDTLWFVLTLEFGYSVFRVQDISRINRNSIFLFLYHILHILQRNMHLRASGDVVLLSQVFLKCVWKLLWHKNYFSVRQNGVTVEGDEGSLCTLINYHLFVAINLPFVNETPINYYKRSLEQRS